MEQIQINQLECKKCNHKWIPRQINISICPKCKYKEWNIPLSEEIVIDINFPFSIFLDKLKNSIYFNKQFMEIGRM